MEKSITKKVIIVPIDANPQSEIALSQAYNLVNSTHSRLMLLGVNDGKNPNIKSRLQTLADEAKSHVTEPVEILVRDGKSVYDEITAVADKLNPLFIILGITQMPGGKIRGNNALQMIRKSKHAIISIGGQKHREGCKLIILPLDLSFTSREKVNKAATIAARFHAEVRIVCVLTNESHLEESKLHTFAKQSIKYLHEKNLAASAVFLKGGNEHVADVVINYSNKEEADLIVIIDEAEIGIREFFKGTSAQHLINKSKIPVLSLRPGERKEGFLSY
jgi:nucleotide-binding universal stress UspA family protein